jgi:hypothetical protein
MTVNDGQLACEWRHLLDKLSARSPARFEELRFLEGVDCHPLFRIGRGPVASWERAPAQ